MSTLDRRRVLDAAVRLVDESGLRQLTMRRLGGALGVDAMALYRYVPGRENLLDGIVETVVDELYGDPEVRMSGRPTVAGLPAAPGVRRATGGVCPPSCLPAGGHPPAADLSLYPHLRSLVPELSEDRSASDFEESPCRTSSRDWAAQVRPGEGTGAVVLAPWSRMVTASRGARRVPVSSCTSGDDLLSSTP
ncbi:TetR family transcriptional regulator [Pseudokineococcus basanitobsidens]|uniref:TetR family transcriptional regulator n=1 Tax=Pseudokineococcus basanitobsidens TaxID=1926649 RepID=A0ABU8RPC0_9ACTN